MSFLFPGYYKHWRACSFKRAERDERIEALKKDGCDEPFTPEEAEVIEGDIDQLVKNVQSAIIDPHDVLNAYAKVAVKAHEKTNCATEFMISAAHQWLRDGDINLKGPLAGIPISLKDNISVGGFDSSTGYSSFVGNKDHQD
ncbi:hypothetical protein IMZ48_08120, partial [Candidatus Bathyarchaeota archaeon]|nr:hypothetical protein [Candidatus Bathyarchaeota archaeon]